MDDKLPAVIQRILSGEKLHISEADVENASPCFYVAIRVQVEDILVELLNGSPGYPDCAIYDEVRALSCFQGPGVSPTVS